MEKKQTKRSDVRLDKAMAAKFGVRIYEMGWSKDKRRYVRFLELLLKYFNEGLLDKTYLNCGELPKIDLSYQSERKRILVNASLKDKAEIRAFKMRLIPEVFNISWLVYDLMKKYNDGVFDLHFPKIDNYE